MATDTTSSSQTEVSRRVALQFCEFINARRPDLCGDLFTDDGSWEVLASVEWGGSVNGKQRADSIVDLFSGFDEWSFTVMDTIAEGNKAVVEGISKGRGPGSTQYNNKYVMVFCLHGEKIVKFTEALDCYQVEKWFNQ